MKSNHFLVILAAFALAACSSDDMTKQTTTAESNTIAFRVAVSKSRADETTVASIEKKGFWARAVKADGTNLWNTTRGVLKFTHDASTGLYTAQIPAGSDVDLKWPDGEVSFYAFSKDPESAESSETLSNDNPPIWQLFSPAINVAEQEDFVYATNKGSKTNFGATAVPLTFKHPLVQVEIRAKSASTKYDVKVKGYKIHYNVIGSPFTFPTPVTANSLGDGTDLPEGSWGAVSKVGATYTNYFVANPELDTAYRNYLSGFYGGYSSNAILLSAQDEQISSGDNGTAMLMPYHEVVYGYNEGTLAGKNAGAYIALLVQANKKDGTALYPGLDENGKRISYRGLPKGYGYIFVPVTLNWNDCVGKKVVYTLDLTYGLGNVDPSKPDVVDIDTYNPETDSNPGTGGTDPFVAGEEVVKSTTSEVMRFTVGTQNWGTVVNSVVK